MTLGIGKQLKSEGTCERTRDRQRERGSVCFDLAEIWASTPEQSEFTHQAKEY